MPLVSLQAAIFFTLSMTTLSILFFLPTILESYLKHSQQIMTVLAPPSIKKCEAPLNLPLSLHSANKKHILIFIAIMSAPTRKDRRDGLRKTWLKHCKGESAVCLIFTDGQDWNGNPLDASITKPLLKESVENGFDMILASSPGGINFSMRYLWMVDYALAHYELDYFLRVDDDHFLCIDRLLWELPQRPKERLVWGYQHCVPGIVRIDEGWHLTSVDVIKEFQSKKNSSLMCHPYGDQAISLWLNQMQGIIYFADNGRVYHGVSANNPGLKQRSELCHSYLSLHGSYPTEMTAYWQIVIKELSSNYTLSPLTDNCRLSKVFNWRTFGSGYYYAEPKPCKDNPTWQKGKMYTGRG